MSNKKFTYKELIIDFFVKGNNKPGRVVDICKHIESVTGISVKKDNIKSVFKSMLNSNTIQKKEVNDGLNRGGPSVYYSLNSEPTNNISTNIDYEILYDLKSKYIPTVYAGRLCSKLDIDTMIENTDCFKGHTNKSVEIGINKDDLVYAMTEVKLKLERLESAPIQDKEFIAILRTQLEFFMAGYKKEMPSAWKNILSLRDKRKAISESIFATL